MTECVCVCVCVSRLANIYSCLPWRPASTPCANWAKVVAIAGGLCPFSRDSWCHNHGRRRQRGVRDKALTVVLEGGLDKFLSVKEEKKEMSKFEMSCGFS